MADRKAEAGASSSHGFNVFCVWAALALPLLAAAGFRFTSREARLALLPLLGFTVLLVTATESLPQRRALADVARSLIAAHGLVHVSRSAWPSRKGVAATLRPNHRR